VTTQPPTFSHKKHVVEEGVECGECHAGIADNQDLALKRAMPKESTCLSCHDRDDDCEKCHKDQKLAGTFQDRRMAGLRFDHKQHLPRTEKQGDEACKHCHAGVETWTERGHSQRPDMLTTCATCHDKTFARQDCTQCHAPASLRHVPPSRDLFAHGYDWMKRHATTARGNQTACSHCHTPDTCTECHSRSKAGTAPQFLHRARPDQAAVHRGDWHARHAVEARLDPNTCQSCHEPATCVNCHTAQRVAGTGLGSKNPHPQGWLLRGGGEFHGEAVRQNPLACAACHDQGATANCVKCHQSGAPGGNPHPPGWHAGGLQKGSAGCVACHR
jgi:hypothetical protein